MKTLLQLPEKIQNRIKERKVNQLIPKWLAIGLLLCLFIQSAKASTFNSKKSGNWSDKTTWGASTYPKAGDMVMISPGNDVIVDIPDAKCTDLTIKAAAGPNSLTIAGTNKLTATGVVRLSNPTNVAEYKQIYVDAGTLEAGSLEFSGGSGARSAIVRLTTGLIQVYGDIKFSSPINLLQVTGTGIIRVGGAFGTNGTFIPTASTNTVFSPGASSTLIFDGTSQQTWPSVFNYAHVRIENTFRVGMDGNFSQGKITGNVTVDKGVLNNIDVQNNSGFSITGMPGRTIQVNDNASLWLYGTTSFPDGFTNKVLTNRSTVYYRGTTQQVAGLTYGNLLIGTSGAGLKTLKDNVTATYSVSLVNEYLNLGNYSLTTPIVSGGAAGSYIVQAGTGRLKITDIGIGGKNGMVEFPVGTPVSYTPAFIRNYGSANTFSVLVTDGVRDNANTLVNSNVVKKTWDIHNETTNGDPANALIRLQWNTTDEGTNFNRSSCFINHFDSKAGHWNRIGNVIQASGANPYLASGDGIVNFSPFAVGDMYSPLPVELTFFKVSKVQGGALLQWETATEKNSRGFEIQLSQDAKTFETVGQVLSQNANSAATQSYQYFDKQNGKSGIWYYRLKQTDLNGTVSFYGPKVVNFEDIAGGIKVYPNPFRNEFAINLKASEASQADLTLTDLSGKIIYTDTQVLLKGNNKALIKLSENSPAGLYLLTAKTSGKVYTVRVLKQ